MKKYLTTILCIAAIASPNYANASTRVHITSYCSWEFASVNRETGEPIGYCSLEVRDNPPHDSELRTIDSCLDWCISNAPRLSSTRIGGVLGDTERSMIGTISKPLKGNLD